MQQAEDSYSASASFEEASISPRASYGDASFESESPRASPRTLSPRVSPSPSPEPAALPGRPRPDDSDASIEDDVEVASASEDSMFGGGGLGGGAGVRGSEDSMFGGGGDADADAPARGAVDASEDSMFGAAGAAPARGDDDDAAAAPLRPRADDQPRAASASDSWGRQLRGGQLKDDAPAPARRPQTVDALFDSDGSDAAPERPPPPPPRRTFPPPAAPPRPPAAPSAFPTQPGMVAAPAADDGDDPCRRAGAGAGRTGRQLTCRRGPARRRGRARRRRRRRRGSTSLRLGRSPARGGARGRATRCGAMPGRSAATMPGSTQAIAVQPSSSKSPMALALLTCGFQMTHVRRDFSPRRSHPFPAARRARPPSRPRAARRAGTFDVMRRCKHGPSRPGTESRACPPVQFYP